MNIESLPVKMEEPLTMDGPILLFPPPEDVVNTFNYQEIYTPRFFNHTPENYEWWLE